MNPVTSYLSNDFSRLRAENRQLARELTDARLRADNAELLLKHEIKKSKELGEIIAHAADMLETVECRNSAKTIRERFAKAEGKP